MEKNNPNKKLNIISDLTVANTRVSVYKYEENYSEELDICKNLKFQKYEEGRVESSFDRGVLFNPKLKNLYDFFQKCINDYTERMLRAPEYKLLIAESWVGRQSENQSVVPHNHISTLNGCFYFDVPDDSTPLMFNLRNCVNLVDQFEVPVANGQLALFPNQLEHWVPPNKSKETRYCLAFNTRIKEEIYEMAAIGKFYGDSQ